jgi:site-specific DNA-methyltransferase (adenine-specific)
MIEEVAPNIQFWAEDCLTAMTRVPSGSVSLVLTDLPYGTTYAPWDSTLPLDVLWAEWKRILKPRGAVVMTTSQPFTSVCVSSNLKWFRCEWVWDKAYPTNFANAKKQPLKVHESVLVFGEGQTTYNPQMTQGKPNHKQGKSKTNQSELRLISKRVEDDLSGLKYPKSIISVPRHSSYCKWHSTQKPVELFEYLIRTYSNPGEMVLDCCAGSGTTGIAAFRTGRPAIIMENDPEYIEAIRARFRLPEELGSTTSAPKEPVGDPPFTLQEMLDLADE